MRLFLAIDLPTKAKKELARQLQEIQTEQQAFRWVPEEHYHLTLHFIGEVPEKKVQSLISKIDKALFHVAPFYLYSSYVDLFIKNKITAYLAFHRSKEAEKIVQSARDELKASGPPFVPHVSIGRYRIPSKQQYFVLKKRFGKLKIDLEFLVDKVTLFESVLGESKPVYRVVETFPLIPE